MNEADIVLWWPPADEADIKKSPILPVIVELAPNPVTPVDVLALVEGPNKAATLPPEPFTPPSNELALLITTPAKVKSASLPEVVPV